MRAECRFLRRVAPQWLHGAVRAGLYLCLLPQLPDGTAFAAAGGRPNRPQTVPGCVPPGCSTEKLTRSSGAFVKDFARNGRKRLQGIM